MLKVLDDPIEIVFTDNTKSIQFNHYYEIEEYDDTIIIQTSVVI